MDDMPNKREQLRQERRQQIIDAALAVFAQKGFNATNVSDVAALAGVSQGTIYWYFESKDDLLTAAVLSFLEDLAQAAFTSVHPAQTSTEKLRALGRSMVDFADAAKGLFTLFLEFWASSSQREEAGQLWTDLLVEYRDFFVAIIEDGIASGEFKPVDARSLAWVLMAAYDGLAAYIMLVPDLDLAAISNTFVETLLHGLEAESTQSAAGQFPYHTG